MINSSKRICLGKIATAHGVRGLVKLLVYGDDPQLLNGVLFTGETGPETLTLTMKNSMGKYWLAEIKGITDRDAALALNGAKLWIDRDSLPATDEDEFYIEDLIGMRAENIEGMTVGKVIAVNDFGAGTFLEIKPLAGGANYYLPFTNDFVPDVLPEEHKVIIIPQEQNED